MTRGDAKLIAECACDLADKALHWKERALSAEAALASFAGEIYARDSGSRRQAEAVLTGSGRSPAERPNEDSASPTLPPAILVEMERCE